MKLTVAKKMALLAGAALLGIVLLTGLGQYQMSRVFQAANYGNENTVPSIRGLSAAIEEFGRTRVRLYRLTLNTDDKAAAAIEDSIKSSKDLFDKHLKDYAALVSDDKDKALLAEDSQLSGQYAESLGKILAGVRAGKRDQVTEEMVKEVSVAQKLNKQLDEHMNYNVNLGQKAADDAVSARNSALTLSLIISALTLLAVGIIAFVLTVIATGATPDDEREYGVEGGGERSRKFLAA